MIRVAPRQHGNVPLGLIGTVVVHGVVLGLFLGFTSSARSAPPVYRVQLVAAPEVQPDARPAPQAIQREAEQPTPPPPAPKPAPKNTASEAAPPPAPDNKKREAAPRTTPKVKPLPGETPSTGSDAATVSTAGTEFPFPEYLQNIVSQVLQRWQRPTGSSPEAEVAFMIHRDGSVSDIQFVRRSGDFGFDLEAQGAIEEAGRIKAFGSLPDGWVADVLFVRFYFAGKR